MSFEFKSLQLLRDKLAAVECQLAVERKALSRQQAEVSEREQTRRLLDDRIARIEQGVG